MSTVAERATATPERGAKKSSRVRDAAGRFVSWSGPGRRPTDPNLKQLAAADRERNFEFIRGMRDDRKMDPELRFEAAKLLAMYSDGKPTLGIVPQGPLVAMQFNGAGAVVGGGSLDPVDTVVTLATQGDSMPEGQRELLVRSVLERGEAAAQRVAERRRAVVLDVPASEPASASAPAIAPAEAVGASAPIAAPAAPGEAAALMSAEDLRPQEVPPDAQVARERWLEERGRGER